MRLSVSWLFAVSMLGISTGAAMSATPRIAEVEVDAQGLILTSTSGFERAVLEVVQPDGQKTRKRFEAGAPLRYDPVGEDGQPLPDGKYRYLLRLTSPEWRGARTQSGLFFVEGGNVLRRSSPLDLPARRSSAGTERRASPLRSGTVGISRSGSVTSAATSANDGVIVYDTARDGITFVTLESHYYDPGPPPIGPFHLGFQNLANNNGYGQLAWIDPTISYSYTSIWTTPSGGVGIGTIPTPPTLLEVYGDARIDGDVVLGSSRAMKTDFEPVEAGAILDGLVGLPLQKWRFRRGSKEAVHLGPFSEDFHATFGLGADNEHVSPIDTAGVAFAAIQGLHAEVESLRKENARLGWVAGLAMLFAVGAPLLALRFGR